jgi:photosystem II stability/assembly factor-like uncharacterized protein
MTRDEREPLPALAALVVFAAVGVLLMGCQARSQSPVVAGSTPSASAAPSPSPLSVPVAGVLNKPDGPIALPAWVDLSAPSTNGLWALVVDRYLYRSTDRGATWKQRPLPPSFAGGYPRPQVSFISDQEGWLSTGGSPETQCNAEVVAIWHTTNAGATWQSLGTNGVSDTQCKGQLSFVDANRGFLDAFDPNRAPVIYRTTDGGTTWVAGKPLQDPPGFKSQDAGFTLQPGRVHAFGATLLVAASAPNLGASTTFVFRSTDGGATWSYLATAKAQNNDVAFVTASRWIQVIAPSQSFETSDGGSSWHLFRSDYSQAAPIALSVVFADSRVGYATVRGSIVRTMDGGFHWDWTAIKTPGTNG